MAAVDGPKADAVALGWPGFATLSIVFCLHFALTACGESAASATDTVGLQAQKSSDAAYAAGVLQPQAGEPATDGAADITADVVTPGNSSSDQAPSNPASPSSPASGTHFSGLRVLPLGDSMTAGSEANPTAYRSYRGKLYQMLQAAGHDVDMIGTQHQLPATGGDPDHDGYGGALIGPGGGGHSLADRVPGILSSVGRVDVIVLALGWNSAYQEPGQAGTKYEGLVRQINALRPDATLVLATLSPQRAETEQQTSTQLTGYRDLNAKARQLAGASATDKIILADLAGAGFRGEDYWDTIHWLQSGADKAARVIFESLTSNASIVNAR